MDKKYLYLPYGDEIEKYEILNTDGVEYEIKAEKEKFSIYINKSQWTFENYKKTFAEAKLILYTKEIEVLKQIKIQEFVQNEKVKKIESLTEN